MRCFFCALPILTAQAVEHHHPEYKSRGGTITRPTHKKCHRNHHSVSGDFKTWGRVGGQISALSKQWSFNLLNVRTDPAYEPARQFNRLLYAN